MSIVFSSRVNTGESGSVDVNIGTGTFQGGAVALQGFYMSYGIDKSYEVESLKAWVGNEKFTDTIEGVVCEYEYRCEMKGDSFNGDDHDTPTTRTSALIISAINS